MKVERFPSWAAAVLDLKRDPAWRLAEDGFEPALEHDVETRFAVSNGFLGVRGSVEQPTRASRPRTYVAGFFQLPSEGAAAPALIPAPNWLRLDVAFAGERMSLESGETIAHSRTLDFRRGLLAGHWRQRLPSGRVISLSTLRLASLMNRAVALQLARIEVEQPGMLTLRAVIEAESGALAREDLGYPQFTSWRTAVGARRLALACASRLNVDDLSVQSGKAGNALCRRWTWLALPDKPATFLRVIAVSREGHTGRDAGESAAASLRRARRAGPRKLMSAHFRAWEQRWAVSDVAIEGDQAAQQALRFALYHLNSVANPEDERTSIGARALTGDAYMGHVFWDTEIFLLPFYIFTWPEAARALLMYRYHTLQAARAKAARLGYRGALYAWESTDTGEETTPPFAVGPDGEVVPILSGVMQHHISSAVAYAVWQYWQTTRDVHFLLDAGAEMMLQTARFWASRIARESDGLYHIRGVMGPDEYHAGVDDNAYTNVMAQWNLERGLEVARLLQARWPQRWTELGERLGLAQDEVGRWSEMAGRLKTGLDEESGLFEQFEGFFHLTPVDLAEFEPRTTPMDVLLGPEQTRRSQVVKQADVVMLLALLWDRFPPEVREVNFRYYEPRCGHGSSISPPVHALVAARLGALDMAERYFRETAAIDLDDTMGNSAGGIHIAALGGLWQAAIFGFAGLAAGVSGLSFNPRLPRSWRAMSFPMRWRGRLVRIRIEQEPYTFTATLARGRPLNLAVGAIKHRLVQGEAWTCSIGSPPSAWKELANG